MARKQIFKYIIILNLFFGSAYAQNTQIVVSNSKEFPGSAINIKWVSDNILYEEGVNLYRRKTDVPLWTKINNEPIKRGWYEIPDTALLADPSLNDYIEIANTVETSELVGMGKVFFLLELVYSNEFAKYIGVQYDDNRIEQGVEYRYMVKRISGDKEIFEAISEPITAGAYIPSAPPADIKVEGKNKKVNMWWKVENDRFHSINIYRYSNYDTIPEKLNPEPFVLAERPGPDGRMSYPDVYFVDDKVNNDTNYFYSLAGIDFFGRETERSAPVMASPRNKTPPPAPELNAPNIKLLDVELNWNPKELRKVVGHYVYRSNSIYKPFERLTEEMLAPLAVRYQDKVRKPGNYYYYIATVDKNGNEGKSNMVMAEVMDIYPPDPPKNLSAVSDSGQISLTWNSVKDEHLEGYRLYRTIDSDNEDFYTLLNTHPVKDTFFIDNLPFNAKNEFYYVVVSLDTALNMSDYSEPASAKLPDIVPPDVPFIKEINNIDGALDIIWLANLESDLMGYHIYREEMEDTIPVACRLNKSIIPGNKLNYIDLKTEKDTEYKYYLKAIDSTGNLSRSSNKYPAIVESRNQAIPVELKNISLKHNITKQTVTVKWQIPMGKDIKGVVVFRRNEGSNSLTPVSGLVKEKEFEDQLPGNGKSFTYKIVAYTYSGSKWTSDEYTINIEE